MSPTRKDVTIRIQPDGLGYHLTFHLTDGPHYRSAATMEEVNAILQRVLPGLVPDGIEWLEERP